MIRKFAAIIMMIFMINLITACSGVKGNSQETASEKRYALLMSHITNEFTMEMSSAVKSKADELGVSLTIFDGENDAVKQINQAKGAIRDKYDGILIEPVSVEGITPVIEVAQGEGIPIVTVNQKITKQEIVDCYVGANPIEGGELQMETVANSIGGKGNVAFLLGPIDSDGQIGRTKGYQNIISSKYPEIKVTYEGSANWNSNEAKRIVKSLIDTGKKMDAIVANNDAMALGALEAVENAKLQDKIKVFGLDATRDALIAVKEGRLAATISQSTAEQGEKAMEVCNMLANNEEVPDEIIVEHTLITKENVDKFLK